MWGFQSHFRGHVQYETQRALNEIGVPVADTQVVLVGIATEENTGHTICVEPETGPVCAEHFVQATDRAKELYHSDPESKYSHTDPRAHELLHRRLFLSARAKAVTEAIEKSGEFDNLTLFVSQSSPINGYEVHTCIGIPTDVIGNLPAFKGSHGGPFSRW